MPPILGKGIKLDAFKSSPKFSGELARNIRAVFGLVSFNDPRYHPKKGRKELPGQVPYFSMHLFYLPWFLVFVWILCFSCL